MPPKRCSSPVAPQTPSPVKRRRINADYEIATIQRTYSLPLTPFPYSFPDDPDSPEPPSTPYPPIPYDSPSNPFGRRRSLVPSLPHRTPFGRHVTLRFQFFRHGMGRDTKGIYRIVQVPLSYTFRHLKILIAFLFGGQVGMDDEEDEEKGHLFEVRKNVEMWSEKYRAGTIKRSKTKIKLSSVSDPYRYKEEWDLEKDDWELEDEKARNTDEAEVDDDDEEIDELDEDETGQRWEAEEDFTLEHVWNSPEDKTDEDEADSAPKMKPVAIVYYHTSASNPEHSSQVHITLNNKATSPRKGRGNTPHVFEARGHVYLCPITDLEDRVYEFEEEDLRSRLAPENWNDPPDAFADYLRRITTLPPPGLYRHSVSSTTSVNSTPGLAHDFSSSPIRSSPFPSTPFTIRRSRSLHSLLASTSSPAPNRLFGGSVPKHTPALPPAQRKRCAYLSKRIERSRQRTKSRPRKKDEMEELKERERLQDKDKNEECGALVSEDSEDEKKEENTEEDDDNDTIRVRGADGTFMTLEEAMKLALESEEQEV